VSSLTTGEQQLSFGYYLRCGCVSTPRSHASPYIHHFAQITVNKPDAGDFGPADISAAPGRCILCGGRGLQEEESFSKFLDLPGNSEARVHRCSGCRMLFLDPYPDAEQLEQLYSESYFKVDNAAGLKSDGKGVDYDDVVRLRMTKFQATVDLLQRFVPAPARLLDVGAATGEFLDVSRSAGYAVAGIELSDFAAQKARARYGLDVFVGALDAYPENARFDVIHLSHVLEHLVDPHRSIEKLSRLLSDRGVIYIEVPFQWNWVEQMHFLKGDRQRFSAFSVHHRSFFRPDTLQSFFSQHGFERKHSSLTPLHRYPVPNLSARAKRTLWRGLSTVGQGLLIEAVFARSHANSR